jgi:uncharacterized protein YfaS (alpha-2-macroglobulin family)
MTFELRFETPMVKGGEIGVATPSAPLIITPPLKGTFTWLSPRSGVFTPKEPLALDTTYRLHLAQDLRNANGNRSKATLDWTVTTAPFSLVEHRPRQGSTNAFSDPEVKLVFNADIPASKAETKLFFRDKAGRCVAADVRQATGEDSLGEWWSGEFRTWNQRFDPGRDPDAEAVFGTNEIKNMLVVNPREKLPLGKGWELVVPSGLAAAESRLRLREETHVRIGDITPFQLTRVNGQNYINSGASIRLEFSKPLPATLTNNPREWLDIKPMGRTVGEMPTLPNGLDVAIWGRAVTLSGPFHGEATYVVKLKRAFQSTEEFPLSGSNEFSVYIPAVPPRLYFPTFSRDQLAAGNRTFPLLAVNVPKAQIRAKLLDPDTAIHALRGYGNYFDREPMAGDTDESYRSVNYNLVPGRTVFSSALDLCTNRDEATTSQLSWDRLLGGRKAGVVFLEAHDASDSRRGPGTQALIQLTDLGLVWKKSSEGVDVFVFSHATGQPVSGATARLYSDENEALAEALTDTNGLAHVLLTKQPPPTTAGGRKTAWVAALKGEDFHAVTMDQDRIWMNSFDLPLNGSGEPEDYQRVMLFSDRTMYRPGEQVHLQALVRQWGDHGLDIPTNLAGALKLSDARGRKFMETNVTFSASGGYSLDVGLPDTSRGCFTAQLRLGSNEYTHTFRVQDFQPSAFEISTSTKPSFGPGEKVEIPVSARYLFGKALSRAQLKWSLDATDSGFHPQRFGAFNFSRSGWEWNLHRGPSSASLNGQGVLNGTSNLIIAPEIPMNPVSPQPRTTSLLVEVTDINQQTLSTRAEFVRHSSDFYLGLKEGAEVLEAGDSLAAEILAVGIDEKPWPKPVKAHLTLQKVSWESVRIQGAGKTVRYHNQSVITNILERDLVIAPIELPADPELDAKGNQLPELPPLDAGQYIVELKAQDEAGRPVASSLNFSVSAPTETAWKFRNDTQLELKPDQKLYTAGQTAEVLVEAPFAGTALVTVEREKVLRSYVTKLEDNAPSIQVPLGPDDVPNVFVSVTLLRGAENCPRKIKEPEFRIGFCQLAVSDPLTRLNVTVATSATNYLPAQSVDVTAQVTDHARQPVPRAELTLYAVDDGILSLSDYQLPDPHAFFYATRPLTVLSSVSLPNLMSEDPEELQFANKGYLGGGGGDLERVRKNFLACAFWKSDAVADADGKVTMRFPAPDSLTRYRVFAVAHEGSKRFGSGESVFHVSKPLVIEPALPRFASITDKLLARGVVQNQTDRAGNVIVSLQLDEKAIPASGCVPSANTTPRSLTQSDKALKVLAREAGESPTLPGALTQEIAVPAHGSAAVEFPVELADFGDSKWIWTARFADGADSAYTDAVESTLPIGHVAPMLREVLLAPVASPETNLLEFANPQLLAGQGRMTVSIANTRLNELGETISQLLHYPYGCAEQTGSSLLPWVTFRDSSLLLPLLRKGTNEVNAAIRAGVTRLFSMQTSSGGLGYWPGAREPMLWASAYGAFVLATAQQHGFEVPTEEMGALLRYLSQELRSVWTDREDFSDACLALYALATAGRSEPAYHEKMYEQRKRLTTEDRALLALAISESHGPPEMIGELLKPGQTTSVRGYGWFGCDTRDQAVRLLAWMAHRPQDPFLDRLVNDLMTGRKEGHWGTTQGDAWALLALAEYARRIEGQLRPASGKLEWAGQTVPFKLDEATKLMTCHFSITNADRVPLKLVNSTTNRLYTSVLIEARPPETAQPRQDRGYSLERRYERLDDDNQPQDLKGLRVGDRMLVTLNLSVREPARFLALDDALPSTLEAINSDLRGQEARGAGAAAPFTFWPSDYREIRKDRCLSFADFVAPGNYTFRYVARVRAAGTVSAPSAKVEEMYHPERCGLSGSQVVTSGAME